MNPSDTDTQTPFGGGSIPPLDSGIAESINTDAQASPLPESPMAQAGQTSAPVQDDPAASALADIQGISAAQQAPVVDPLAQALPGTSAQAGSASQYSPKIADDVDLIEKEWVTKAKMIINNTRGNPNEQNKELSRFKADYLKTRYSKDLKVND